MRNNDVIKSVPLVNIKSHRNIADVSTPSILLFYPPKRISHDVKIAFQKFCFFFSNVLKGFTQYIILQ